MTGFTPYELMFGRQPRLPVDLAFGLPVREGRPTSHSDYVKNLKSRLEESYKIAMDNAAKIAHKNKTRFDRRVTASDLEVGDRVLIRNVKIRGKHKISDKWESAIYVVVTRTGALPVYTVKPESKDGPLRTLHRDLLLPCGYLPAEESNEPDKQPARRRPATRATPAADANHSEEEEDGDEVPVYWFRNSPNAHVPTVVDSPTQPEPPMTTEQDTQRTELPGVCPTESPVNADRNRRIDNSPEMSDGISANPLALNAPTSDQGDTGTLPAEIVIPTEEVQELNRNESNLPDTEGPVENSDLPEQECPVERETLPDEDDIRNEQLPVLSDMSESEEETDGTGNAEPEEEGMEKLDETDTTTEKDTEEHPSADTSVKRSERSRQPPKRLEYAELGNPLVTVVKSFLHGLNTVFSDALSEVGSNSPAPTPRIMTV